MGVKRLLTVILVLWGLGAVVPGCRHALSYDGRLTAVDSLMKDNPDSALALVEALSLSDLPAEGDRAYRDLLLTQARYKAYVTATSDSDINRALAYFRAHPADREKLTRAYIYKGAVMDELGYPDSAMLYYKHAEIVVPKDDYVNLGQINIRIASLFRIHYANEQICYDKYQNALDCYRHTGNKKLQLICIYNMGMCSGITGSDDSKQLLNTAASMALEQNDSLIYFDCEEMLIRQLLNEDSILHIAKDRSLYLLQQYPNLLTNDLLIDLAYCYCYEGQVDSAKYYIRIATPRLNLDNISHEKIRLYSLRAKIADLEGKETQKLHYLDSCKQLSDSTINDGQKYRIQEIEKKLNEEQLEINKNKDYKKTMVLWSIILFALLIIGLLLLRQYKKNQDVIAIIQEIKKSSINTHDTLLGKLLTKETSIENLVRNMVDFMQFTINTTENDSPSVIRKRIKQKIQSVVDDNFWRELRFYLDKRYNNIISNIAKNPRINETDIRFIELVCCGFSYVEIAITLGYSTNYVSNKRIKIQKKLKLKETLSDYLNQAMKG